jgi:hypothetical protein
VPKLGITALDEFIAALCRGRMVFALEEASGSGVDASRPRIRMDRADADGQTVFTVEEEPGNAPPPRYHLVKADAWQPGRHTLGAYRPVEPLKGLVFRPREFLGALGKGGDVPSMPERVVLGAKACDVSALAIHDHVFVNTEPADPFYAEAREKTIIVSADCTDCRDVCFCTAVGEQPYPKEGFDINLSPTPEGILVEPGSDRGQTLLNAVSRFLSHEDDAIREARDASRAAVAKKVRAAAAARGLEDGMDFRKAVAATVEHELWEQFAEDCVECGACNFACCTCHCFLLADGRSKADAPARVKEWDSCLYRNFARVAGGANPRGHRAARLQNRFDKKFNFFPQILERYACDGCGRCVEACTGKIDIRDVLKRAVDAS